MAISAVSAADFNVTDDICVNGDVGSILQNDSAYEISVVGTSADDALASG
ncbi:hypothetical protein [Methanobrevibacter sp.]|nr:hypothetical protein [Methanobrevibacter sp.]MDO5860640.1 hypothetical protein [Methanobrevibacter sp.]